MNISDLPSTVTASKADWLAGTSWLGFTPKDGSSKARAACQATINRQFGLGYVIEYITESFNTPNSGFQHDARTARERKQHALLAGRFIAIHRLRATSRSLIDVIGPDEFKELQDRWAQNNERYRWSVSFPIIETYEIKGKPKAKTVLGEKSYQRLYGHSSATLRPLNDEERELISKLELEPKQTTNAWIGIVDEFAAAERSEVNPRSELLVGQDLGESGPEGMLKERWAKVRRRAAWLADRFIRERSKAGRINCDQCGFDPSTRPELKSVKPRSLLDVHHKNPLAEGVRYTTITDFVLLCPTCHRVEHALQRVAVG